MKKILSGKFLSGAAFFLAVCACTGGLYYIIMNVDAGYAQKAIFSAALLLLALVLSVIASAVQKKSRAELVVKTLNGRSAGCAIFNGKEAVFKTKRFEELETKSGENILDLIASNGGSETLDIRAENVTVDGKTVLYAVIEEKQMTKKDVEDE